MSFEDTPDVNLTTRNGAAALFGMALAEGFEEDNTGGDGDVERFYGAGGGQRDDEIAAFAG